MVISSSPREDHSYTTFDGDFDSIHTLPKVASETRRQPNPDQNLLETMDNTSLTSQNENSFLNYSSENDTK